MPVLRQVACLAACLGMVCSARILAQDSSVATRAVPDMPAPQSRSTLRVLQETGVVKIGFRPSAYPFNLIDSAGRPDGYALDLCRQALDGVRRELKLVRLSIQYVRTSTVDRLRDLNEHKIDLECAFTANDPGGQRMADFALPYFVAKVRMLVPTGSAVRDYGDLRHKTVVTTENTPALLAFRDRNRLAQLQAKIIVVRDHAQAFKIMQEGKADAWVMNDVLLNAYRAIDRNPHAFEIRGTVLVTNYVSAMLRKGDTEFRKLLDRQLIALIQNGNFEKTYHRWFLQRLADGNAMNMPMSFSLREFMRFPVSPMPYD